MCIFSYYFGILDAKGLGSTYLALLYDVPLGHFLHVCLQHAIPAASGQLDQLLLHLMNLLPVTHMYCSDFLLTR